MSVNLIGVSASGGIPLFCRQKSTISSEGIPFVKMASLNSVNLFSRLNDTNLRSTLTADSSIHWKTYRGSIVLIMVTTVDKSTSFREVCPAAMDRLLDFIFDTIILTCGLSKLIETNTESLKSSLRSSFPAIDYILDQLYSGNYIHLSLLKTELSLTDSWATPFMETLVDTAARLASSQYCCLIARRRVVSATKHWWNKIASTRDCLLIINLVNSFSLSESSSNLSREATIYLPENCPNSPVRLVCFLISPRMVMVFLCGEAPTIKQLQETVVEPLRESKKDQEMFRKIVTDRRIPLHLDENIINLIVCRQDRNIFTLLGSLDSGKLRDLLRLIELASERQTKLSSSSNMQLDCYVHFNGYKGYYCESSHVKLFLLLPFEKQLFDLKHIGDKTLSLIAKEKKLWP